MHYLIRTLTGRGRDTALETEYSADQLTLGSSDKDTVQLPGRQRHVAASIENKNSDAMIADFNRALAAAKKDGSYQAIIKKWDERYRMR